MDLRFRFRTRAASSTSWIAVAAFFFLVLALVAAPAAALADEYSIPQVNIDATLDSDGVLTVAESRTFDFDGDFHGVYWDIPKGENPSNGRDVELTVLAAGEGDAGDLQTFTEGYGGVDGTYEISDRGDVLRLKIYSAPPSPSRTVPRASLPVGTTRESSTGSSSRTDGTSSPRT